MDLGLLASPNTKEPELRHSGSLALDEECMLKDPSTRGSIREERSFYEPTGRLLRAHETWRDTTAFEAENPYSRRDMRSFDAPRAAFRQRSRARPSCRSNTDICLPCPIAETRKLPTDAVLIGVNLRRLKLSRGFARDALLPPSPRTPKKGTDAVRQQSLQSHRVRPIEPISTYSACLTIRSATFSA